MLRGVAWGITKNFDRATQIASMSDATSAYVLILVGVWSFFAADKLNGFWICLVGWFLLNAAKESYSMVTIRHTLTGVRAQDIMSPDVPSVERNISIEDYVNEVMRTGRRFTSSPARAGPWDSSRSMPENPCRAKNGPTLRFKP